MKKNKILMISIHAMGIAILSVITIFIQIPLQGGAGYLNFSDSIIFLFSGLFGPYSGMVVGGLGALIADFASGYATYAPFSLVIKALEGLLAGFLFKKWGKLNFLSFFLAGLCMAVAYMIPDTLLFNFSTATYNLLWNSIQGIVNAFIATLILKSYSLLKDKQKPKTEEKQ